MQKLFTSGMVLSALLLLASPTPCQVARQAEVKVTEIPQDIIKRYKLDTSFYKKHLDYKGFSIFSSAKVSDAGLYEARYLMNCLL